MNVFYEEDGGFKVGTVLSSTDAALQVEAPHGKRSKIKTNHVLLRFTSPKTMLATPLLPSRPPPLPSVCTVRRFISTARGGDVTAPHQKTSSKRR